MVKEQEREMKKYNYFIGLGILSTIMAETQGIQFVPSIIADVAVTELARKSLLRYTGIKKFHMGSTSSRLLAITGKNLVSWFINGLKSTAQDGKKLQDKNAFGSRWLPAYLMFAFVPELIKHELISRCFAKAAKTCNVDYPDWIYNRWWLLLVAWQLSAHVSEFCSDGLEFLYDWIVPKTNAQKYIRHKKMMELYQRYAAANA